MKQRLIFHLKKKTLHLKNIGHRNTGFFSSEKIGHGNTGRNFRREVTNRYFPICSLMS